jgi:hypothetical protein
MQTARRLGDYQRAELTGRDGLVDEIEIAGSVYWFHASLLHSVLGGKAGWPFPQS